jgi:hypothetical protein
MIQNKMLKKNSLFLINRRLARSRFLLA